MKPATHWMYAAFLSVLISALCFGFAAESAFAALPDGRIYELVSASSNLAEVYIPTAPSVRAEDTESEEPFQVASNGDSVVYVGESGVSGGNGDVGPQLGEQWLATRTSAGWQTSVITPEHSGEGTAFQGFSGDLSIGFLEAAVQPPLTADALVGCQALYSHAFASDVYSAVFTTTNTPEHCGHPLFAGTSANSHVVFQSEAALISGAPEATELPPGRSVHHLEATGFPLGEPCDFGCNLYDSSGGSLHLVNVLPPPEEKVVTNANFGGYASGNNPDLSNVISTDGSRIFWTDTQEGEDLEHVYVREGGTHTVQVSGAGAAEYWTATPDGRYAFYTEGSNLWRFDTESNSRKELAGPGAGVLGVIGISTSEEGGEEPGSYVYFVAQAKLASNENLNKEKAHEGEPNLYVLRGEAVHYIVTLSPSDDNLKGGENQTSESVGDWAVDLGDKTAEVTPDGHHLVFESRRMFTHYANSVVNGEGNHEILEVYVYDTETGQIACASCSPAGAPPLLLEAEQARKTLLPVSRENDTDMRRLISADGSRVFFQSPQPLVSADTNDHIDVYEWEQEGTAGCPVATSLYGGCVFLLSGGESSDNSLLVGADATGDNVFFTHRGQLGPTQPMNDRMELYDTRVNGGFPQTAQACTGTGCQGVAPAPPSFATPPSVTFNGAGNYPSRVPVAPKSTGAPPHVKKKKCPKDKKLERNRCVRPKPKHKKKTHKEGK
jgi:hypothetical protein